MSFGDAIIAYFISPILFLLWLAVIVNLILSWLIHFNVINYSNQLVSTLWRISTAITEPFLRPLRQVIPPIGGLDFSVLVLLLVLSFVRGWVVPFLYTLV